MITEIRIEDFKSYHAATLPLAPLTVLIGANASGKSNAIEAIRFLSWLAQGRRLPEILRVTQDSDSCVRGGLNDLAYPTESAFTLGCTLAGEKWNRFRIRIRVDGDDLRVDYESISDPAERVPLYEIDQPAQGLSHDVRVAYNNFARGGVKPKIICSDQFAIFMQLESAARFDVGHKTAQSTIPKITGDLRQQLSSALFLDPRPAVMRDYSFTSDKKLREDGRNLSSVLFNLWWDASNRESILSFIASLPEQDIRDLNFITAPRGEVMFELTETFGGTERKVPAPLLSDGTLRVLAIAAALLSAPEGALVVIEEIDNGVHPGRAATLLKGILGIAERRHLEVLLTSHNPALLDALPDRAVPDVVFCYRDPVEGDSRLVRLQNIADYPELIAQGGVGYLLTTGILDRFVKHHPRPDEKKAKALAWLESLRSGDGA
ncbi:putative ATPase [Plasticicumulans lactativorans]|uniref:Putative ATPase n=1 Tax=Plasticicumulans lactativorans TaxID=1133106 RepID=A0A4V2SC87_9GAMM|nr:ATP-binding protein [Plasticicumulans lactativorans]TCO78130.1 putative ATPase [Plasticicumulans lactativorans]